MLPAAHDGGCITWQVPQLQAPDALGPSKTSWLGVAEKPDGQGEVCAGAKATSDHPLGTAMHEPGEVAHGSAAVVPPSVGLAIEASSGNGGGAFVFPASGFKAVFTGRATSSPLFASISAAST